MESYFVFSLNIPNKKYSLETPLYLSKSYSGLHSVLKCTIEIAISKTQYF